MNYSQKDSVELQMNPMTHQMKFSLAMNQRKILIYDLVSEHSVLEGIYYLNKLRENDQRFHKEEKLPIEIQINTNGGLVEDGLTLISLIEQMKDEGYHIITTNIGRAYSMGFLLSICGSERRAYRYARYMYHDMSFGLIGSYKEFTDAVADMQILKGYIAEIVTKYTKLTNKELDDIEFMKVDRYFTPQELKAVGGVDTIG